MWHKYNAKPTTVNGVRYDSKSESGRFRQLELLQQAGVISNLKLKPIYELQPSFVDNTGKRQRAVNYEADASYTENGREVVEDVKGFETAAFKIKRKMFLYHYPQYELRIIKA